MSRLGIGAVFALLAAPGCASTDTDDTPQEVGGAPARPAVIQRANALKSRFPAAFVAPSVARAAGADIEIPTSADRALRIKDVASKIGVGVLLDGARAVAREDDEGLSIYPGAAMEGAADVIHRVVAVGVEDLVHVTKKPSKEAVSYTLDVSAAAGLRLVGGALEVLDPNGIPVLRAAAPYVVDATGATLGASLSVEGCAVDTSPAPPFRRAVTPPGATSCTVVVDWSAAHAKYPVLVDPVWGVTLNTMAVARTHHTLTLLNPTDVKSLALVAGGASSVNGAPLKSAEIYDPLSRRFSNTGDMNVARSAHTATLITALSPPPGLGPNEPVLVAGGVDAGGNPLSSLEVYDPATGTFGVDPNAMPVPRFEHAATLIDDDTILIAGGTAPPLNQPTNTAYVYTFTSFGTSTLVATGSLMKSARAGLAATRLQTGDVLLTGGFVLAGGALQALQDGELYKTAGDAFVKLEGAELAGGGVGVMTAQRGYHTSVALGTTGKVLIVGGLSKTVGGIYTNTADIFLDGSVGTKKGFDPPVTPITMASSRANHTSTLLPDGRVLVAGGFSGAPAAAISGVEVFTPAASTFADLGSLNPMGARGEFAALLVNAGDSATAGHTVLVTGGASSPTTGAAATTSAQILIRPIGDACTIDDDCLSGFCTDGVCCEERCDALCVACKDTLKQSGADSGKCEPAAAGADPKVQCIKQVETHTQCKGDGTTELTTATKICLPASCDGQGLFCSTGCDSSGDCDPSGWCDLETIGEDGTPGKCQQKFPPGVSCYSDEQCLANNYCVDGVCCATKCDLQCQACDVPGLVGQCQVLGVPGKGEDVHPNLPPENVPPGTPALTVGPRTACDGFVGTEHTTCTGTCQGTAEVCSYPGPTEFIQDKTCADDPNKGPSTLTSYPCDSAGGNTETDVTCDGFTCKDDGACKTDCTADTDCITDFVCTDNACVALTGPLCDGKDVLRQPVADGGYVQCPDNYACPAGATACLTSCQSINDCITREGDEKLFVCNGDNQCVPKPEPPLVTSCATHPGSSDTTSHAFWLLLAAAGLVASRRKQAL